MKFDAHGSKQLDGKINSLVSYFEKADDTQNWFYMGMKVELDPTVYHQSQNMLFRWLDIEEGFNDRIIVNSLEEFKLHFSENAYD